MQGFFRRGDKIFPTKYELKSKFILEICEAFYPTIKIHAKLFGFLHLFNT